MGKIGGTLKLNFLKQDAGVSGEGNISKTVSSVRDIQEEYDEVSNLVTFMGGDDRTDELIWKIANVNKEALTGTVIGSKDKEHGVLGIVESPSDGGWSVQPSIEVRVSAQLVDDAGIDSQARKAVRKARKTAAGDGKKLGVIGALLNKEIRHTPLRPLILEQDDD